MTRRAALLVVVLGAAWGAVYPLTAVGLSELEPAVVVVARTALAAVVLLPVAWRTGALSAIRQRFPTVLIAAMLQATFPLVLLTMGQEHVAAGIAGILLASQPVWASVITSAITRLVSGAEVVGVLVGLGGVGLIFANDLDLDSTTASAGVALLAAAMLFAGGAVYVERIIPDIPALATATAAMVVTTIALVPFAVASAPDAPSASVTLRLVLLGVGATGAALVLFYALVQQIGAVQANLAGYLAPAFALLYGRLFLKEAVTAGALLGLALVVIGSYVTSARLPTRRTPKQMPSRLRASAPNHIPRSSSTEATQ